MSQWRVAMIDGKAIVCDDDRGAPVFDLIRSQGILASGTLCAFDLIELDSEDYRRQSIEAANGC